MNTPCLLLSLDHPLPFILGTAGAWYLLLSMIAFAVFAHDKRAARRQRRRVPEKRLHLLELVGGFPGAWAAIILFHHKSRKSSFLFISVLCTLVNVAAAFIVFRLLASAASGVS